MASQKSGYDIHVGIILNWFPINITYHYITDRIDSHVYKSVNL